jgi:hypothetical protein
MSEFYGSSDEAENLKVLQHAIDIGCTFWDTAGKLTKEVRLFEYTSLEVVFTIWHNRYVWMWS